jgi:DNA polymerase III delta prime subunit
MVYLEQVDEFKKQFSLSLLNSPALQQLIDSFERDRSISDLPNILLYGPDQLTLSLCLNMLLKEITKSTRLPTKHEPCDLFKFPHDTHPQYLSVDMSLFKFDDRANFILFVKSCLSTDCLNPITKRHIIVIKNAQMIPDQMILALRKMTEDSRCTTLFILTTNHLSGVEKSILSRFMLIRCCINVFAKSKHILELLNFKAYHLFLDMVIKKSEGNVSKFLLLLKRPQRENESFTFMLDSFIDSRLHQILKENITTIITDTAIRFEKSGLQPVTILKTLALKLGPDYISFFARMDIKFKQSNKYAFAYEELLWGIKKIYTNDNNKQKNLIDSPEEMYKVKVK